MRVVWLLSVLLLCCYSTTASPRIFVHSRMASAGSLNDIVADIGNYMNGVEYLSIKNSPLRGHAKVFLEDTLDAGNVCTNTRFRYVITGLPGRIAWSRPIQTDISNDPLPAAWGEIIDDSLNTTSVNPVKVIYWVTSTVLGSRPLKIVVNPIPTVFLPADISVCNGTRVNNIILRGTINNTVFKWNGDHPEIGLPDDVKTGTPDSFIPAFTARNTSDIALTNRLVVTPTLNGCQGIPKALRVIVNPTADVIVPVNQAYCNGVRTQNMEIKGTVAGTTFNWTNNITTIGLAASGVSSIAPFVPVNNGRVSVMSTILVTPNSNCAGSSKSFTITVKPTPTVILPDDFVVCDGSVVSNLVLTGALDNTSFGWVGNHPEIGLPNDAGTGAPNSVIIPAFTARNSTTDPITDVIQVTPTLDGCSGPSDELNITVNPIPMASSPVDAGSICSKELFTYTARSKTSGVAFSWSRPAIPGISNAAVSNQSGAFINESLINTTSAPIVVTYKISMQLAGCAPNEQEVTVTVKPTPALSNAPLAANICNNSLFNYTPSSIPPGAVMSWSRPATYGVSNNAATGVGVINETLSDSIAQPVKAKYIYNLSLNGCSNNGLDTVFVTVNPTPRLLNLSNPATSICNNTLFNYSPSSSVQGATYSWKRAAVYGLSNAANSGREGISEILNDTLSSPVVVKYMYTASANGCMYDAIDSVIVSVSPTPRLSNKPVADTICNDKDYSFVPNSRTSGVNYSWQRLPLADITPSVANGIGTINDHLLNSAAFPVAVTYLFTVTSNGCVNPIADTVRVVVQPTPVLANLSLNDSICNKGIYLFTARSNSPNIDYSWSRAAIVGIKPATNSAHNALINEALENTTTAPITVVYKIAMHANGCNDNIQNITVVVKPTPVLSNIRINDSICNKTMFRYAASSNTSNATYSWSRDAVTGITNPSVATHVGGDIAELLENTTSNPITVVYKIALHINGCVDNNQLITVVVKPTPVLSNIPVQASVCNKEKFTYTLNSSTTNIDYTWSRGAVDGIIPSTGSGSGIRIDEVLENTSANALNVVYKISMHTYGCADNIQEINVEVKPTPILSSILMPSAICPGTHFSYTAKSITVGTIFSWIRPQVPGMQNENATGAGADINERLVSVVNRPVNVTYYINLRLDDCKENIQPVVVTVKPSAVISVPKDIIVCENTFSGELRFTSNVDGTSYSWTNNNSTIGLNEQGEGSMISFTALNKTRAPISAVVTVLALTQQCSGNAQTFKITVIPRPQMQPVDDIVVCNQYVQPGIVFSSNVEGAVFKWVNDNTMIGIATKNGEGNITGFRAINEGNKPIYARIVVVSRARGCEGMLVSFKVTVLPTPRLASGTNAIAVCSGQKINYHAASTVENTFFTWGRAPVPGVRSDSASGYNDITEDAVNTTDNPISVKYKYILNAQKCINVVDLVVRVKPIPAITISGNNRLCSAATLQLQADVTTGAEGYLWSGPGGFSAVTKTISISAVSANNAGKYTVTVTKDNCISRPAEQMVSVFIKPAVSISGPGEMCENAPAVQYTGVDLTGLPGKGFFSGPGINSSGLFTATVGGAGVFSVRYTYASTDGCQDSKEINVRVYPTPKVDAGTNKILFSGNGVNLDGSIRGAYTSFVWIPAVSSEPNLKPWVSPAQTTSYRLSAMNASGCSSHADVTVQVINVRVPNSFSPNGDGINDTWVINGVERYADCLVEIFNRWGGRIYTHNGLYIPWDGKANGQLVPAGTYYYRIELRHGGQKVGLHSGWLEIVR